MRQPIAAEWLEKLWEDRAGRTSMQVLCEYSITLARKIRPALTPLEAWDRVRSLLMWKPQPVDAELLLCAREIEQRYQLSWWDSMIVGAAQMQSCALLLTEDLQDRATYGGVTVRNPFNVGVSEAMATYAAAPVTTPAHPRRGRPRRARV